MHREIIFGEEDVLQYVQSESLLHIQTKVSGVHLECGGIIRPGKKDLGGIDIKIKFLGESGDYEKQRCEDSSLGNNY